MKKSTLFFPITKFGLAFALASLATTAGAGDVTWQQLEAPNSEPASPSPQGLRVFKDPETGEIRAPTPEEAATVPQLDPLKASEGNYIVVPSSLAGGGVRLVHPDGAFISTMRAVKGADGRIRIQCETELGPTAPDHGPEQH